MTGVCTDRMFGEALTGMVLEQRFNDAVGRIAG